MNKTHGFGEKEKLYSVWSNMKNRCNNPRSKEYRYYGAKGVKVCDEWDDYSVFRAWAYANGYKENEGLSIDRINVDGMYSPENCRWATVKQQMNNMTSNHLVEHNGEVHTLSEWSDITGLPYRVIEARLRAYNWSTERALTTPVNGHIRLYEYNGETHTIVEWAEIYNLNFNTLYNRINRYKWSMEKALNTPPKEGGHYQ